jgi:hypothetical protein
LLGKNEIGFLSRAPVGETVTDEKNGIIFFSVVLDEFPFASSAKTALLLEVREGNVYSAPLPEMGAVGIERDLREVMNFQNFPDVEIETIADNFDIDSFLTTISVEDTKGRVDLGMFLNKAEYGWLIPIKDFCNSDVGLL